MAVSLYAYQDYRLYLRDWYQHAKKTRRGFSFRAFSKQADLASPNFLKLVMDGDRGLSEEGIFKFARGLDLNKTETDFFKNLVFFTQAADPQDKVVFEKRMMKSQAMARLKPIEQDQYHLYSAWYHPVVLELVSHPKFNGTPEWLSRTISPPVNVSQAHRSLELLARLGFVQKEGDRYRPSQAIVTTGPEASSLIMMDYHQSVLRLCAQLLPYIPAEDRDVSSLTFAVSKKKMGLLKKKIVEFRQDLVKWLSDDTPPEEAYLLNMQLMPMTGYPRAWSD